MEDKNSKLLPGQIRIFHRVGIGIFIGFGSELFVGDPDLVNLNPDPQTYLRKEE